MCQSAVQDDQFHQMENENKSILSLKICSA